MMYSGCVNTPTYTHLDKRGLVDLGSVNVTLGNILSD